MDALLTDLSDAALVSSLEGICFGSRALLARLIVHLAEVEERRLHLKAAFTSMFDFCTRRLGMSEGAAFRRINAARLAKRFPMLVRAIERGDVNLEMLVLVRDHLTEANVEEVVAAVSHKSKREVEEIVARRAPRPDVPSLIRKLPTRGARDASVQDASAMGPTNAGFVPSSPPSPSSPHRADRRIEPIAAERYKLQLTASAELRDKLERARDLMRHRNPSGDLAVVVERAVDALLEKLEKERLGAASRPQRNVRTAKAGRVSRAARREVFERDGEQCTFVNGEGSRCESRAFLELDHIASRALGGLGDAANLRVMCRSHNQLHAEQTFGRSTVARCMDFRQRKPEQRKPEQRKPEQRKAEQRKSEQTASARTSDLPRPAADPTLDAAMFGLKNMGFRDAEARRALAAVAARHPGRRLASPLEQVLREALAVLT